MVAYLAGHDHDGGFAWDTCGLLHITVPAVIETPPGNQCCGVVEVYKDRVDIVGFGRVPQLTIPLTLREWDPSDIQDFTSKFTELDDVAVPETGNTVLV